MLGTSPSMTKERLAGLINSPASRLPAHRHPAEYHFTGMRTGASFFFKSTTMNFAGLVLLALRLIR